MLNILSVGSLYAFLRVKAAVDVFKRETDINKAKSDFSNPLLD